MLSLNFRVIEVHRFLLKSFRQGLLSLFLFLIAGIAGYSQDFTLLEKYTISSGLPDRTISSVVQDHEGFLWIGSDYGVSRFDGYNFVNFNSKNSENFTNNKITSLLLVDSVLWIGTASDLLLLDLNSYEFSSFKFKTGRVHKLFADSKGRIWIVNDKGEVHLFDNEGTYKIIEEAQPVHDWIRSTVNQATTIGEQGEGIWWGRLDGTIRQYDELSKKVEMIFDGSEHQQKGSVTLLNDSLVWHSTNQFLKLYHIDRGELAVSGTEAINRRANAQIKLVDGSMLLANFDNSIVRANAEELSVSIMDDLDRIIENSGQVNAIYESDNLLWLASNSGLYKLKKEKKKFDRLLADEDRKISVRSIYERNGQFLVSTYSGLFYLNEKGLIQSQVAQPFYLFYEMLPKTLETYWVASEGLGLLEFNWGTGEINHLTYEHGNEAYQARFFTSIEEDDSVLWIGDYSGLYYYHKQNGTMNTLAGTTALEGVRVNDVHLANGRLWVASDQGLYSVEKISGALERVPFSFTELENFEVRVIEQTSDGLLWIGTKEMGLIQFNPTTKEARQWSQNDGLSYDAVNTIETSNDEQFLWIGTDYGLSQYDRETNVFINYYETDGITNNEFNKRAILKTSDGNLYMGGIDGINVFDPGQLTKEKSNPKLLLTAFSKYDGVEGRVIAQPVEIVKGDHFELAPNDRFFSFHFALADYENPMANQFRYRIKEIHEKWMPLGTQRELLIDNLEAGSYSLIIQGTNGDGHWSSEKLALSLTIQQVYYKTWWFMMLVGALMLFLGWMAHKIRLQQLLKLERVRVRIARDLHDELGSSLTRISMYSELARETSDSKDTLDSVASMSRDAASTLSDIVWSIDNTDDSLDSLLDRIKDHLHLMATDSRLQPKFLAADVPVGKQLKAEVKQNVFLIAKEAINNSLKYSNGDSLNVNVRFENGLLCVNIVDNGNSEEEASKITKGGNGLRNMQKRAEQMGGKLNISKAEGYGVSISVQIS